MIFVVRFDPTLLQCIRTRKPSQRGRVSFQIFEVMIVRLAYVIYQNQNLTTIFRHRTYQRVSKPSSSKYSKWLRILKHVRNVANMTSSREPLKAKYSTGEVNFSLYTASCRNLGASLMLLILAQLMDHPFIRKNPRLLIHLKFT
ncbi:hypothetical protein PILCRDRAFT_758002 [Piloderma croceum F 1598]|uniref:Uncharacterized protein n=1 Tax=Piloderma croceum (strain F 1598) TaxID=765440 RepID=A0A0C3B213_PILCF|nr:hypothetical protein PILCRDRAFT_758002 [Piloderma croceum F 1598]